MSFLYSVKAADGTPHVSAQPSLLAEYVLFPFYDWIVQFYPKSWWPNKLTLFGVSCTLLSSVLLLCSMPFDAAFDPPVAMFWPVSWILKDRDPPVTPYTPTRIIPILGGVEAKTAFYSLCAILNLIYCVADNTDGRLARRDKKTSAVGEYLDHGLDCVTSLLSACMAFCVMGGNISMMSVSVCMIALVTVLSHTLHYELNIFVWGTRLATVDEAMLFFGFCMWIALAAPFLATDRPLTASWLETLPLLNAYPTVIYYLSRLTYIECIYVGYNSAQFSTILSVAARRWGMLFRLPTLFTVINGVVLMGVIPSHSAMAAAVPPVSRTALHSTQLGPLMYPAVWIVTAATTFSTIVHVVIFSKCANRKRADFLPLAGLVFVWFAFLTCPVGGMTMAVLLHVTQVGYNLAEINRKGKK